MYDQHNEKKKEMKLYNLCTEIHLMQDVMSRKKSRD